MREPVLLYHKELDDDGRGAKWAERVTSWSYYNDNCHWGGKIFACAICKKEWMYIYPYEDTKVSRYKIPKCFTWEKNPACLFSWCDDYNEGYNAHGLCVSCNQKGWNLDKAKGVYTLS